MRTIDVRVELSDDYILQLAEEIKDERINDERQVKKEIQCLTA
jgi:hypothetical protein